MADAIGTIHVVQKLISLGFKYTPQRLNEFFHLDRFGEKSVHAALYGGLCIFVKGVCGHRHDGNGCAVRTVIQFANRL